MWTEACDLKNGKLCVATYKQGCGSWSRSAFNLDAEDEAKIQKDLGSTLEVGYGILNRIFL